LHKLFLHIWYGKKQVQVMFEKINQGNHCAFSLCQVGVCMRQQHPAGFGLKLAQSKHLDVTKDK